MKGLITISHISKPSWLSNSSTDGVIGDVDVSLNDVIRNEVKLLIVFVEVK